MKIRSIVILFAVLTSSLSAQSVSKKHGNETVSFNGGTASGKVKHGKKQGLWKYYDPSGNLYQTLQWQNDKENGMLLEYVPGTSRVTLRGKYVKGLREGVFEGFYQDGKTSYKKIFLNDSLDGLQQSWYNNGQLKEQSFYINKQSTYTWMWYDNGSPAKIEYYAAGKKIGKWRTYLQPTGVGDTCPLLVEEYANDKLSGLRQTYSGCIMTGQEQYLNGMLNGIKQKWADDGKLISVENYSLGVLDGVCDYYSNGIHVEVCTYKNGFKNGRNDIYDLSGYHAVHYIYSEGRIDTAISYYRKNKFASTRYYKRYVGIAGNEEYSEYTEYDSTGVVLLKGKYHFDKKVDVWTTYYPNGKERSETTYLNGKISRIYRKWYVNGKKMLEVNCDGDPAIDPPRAWNKNGVALDKNSREYKEIVEGNLPGETFVNSALPHSQRTLVGDDHEAVNLTNRDVTSGRGGSGNSTVVSAQSEIIDYAEQTPVFPGGDDSLKIYLGRVVKFPAGAKQVNGTVYVQFVVETDGSISNVGVAKSDFVDERFNNAAMNAISGMPKWTPGKQAGKVVRVRMIQPVKFYAESSGN